ncbi:MAG TPA: type 4a pilus biogenesis protein PilO [Actinomycetota bacterium]|nr:type 4a pilus biogenesis protein PilO [Actinomycetota bacterium]
MRVARGPLIAGIVAGVIAILLIVLLVLPKMSQVGQARDDLEVAEQQEFSLQTELRSLQDAQAQAPETEQEIQVLEDQVPTTVDLPGLFRLLQGAADQAAVDFFQFSPGTPAADPSGAFSTVSSQIVVTGSYFTLQDFLFSLETLPRAAKVMSVGITPTTGTTATATVTTATGRLQMQLAVEFYTTDASAGPGSEPGPSESVATVQAASVQTDTTTDTNETATEAGA